MKLNLWLPLLVGTVCIGLNQAHAHDMTQTPSAQQALQELSLVLKSNISQKEFVHYSNNDGGTKFLGQMVSNHGARAVCHALEHMKTEDLALFIQALESKEDLTNLTCKSELLIKYATYLSNQGQALYAQQIQQMNFRSNRYLAKPLYVSKTAPTVHSNRMAKGVFVLTFDDGPHPSRTPALLQILDRYNIKALFFPVGRNVSTYPQIVRDIERRGHSIGSHTWSHPDLSKRSYASGVQEIERGIMALMKVLGFSDPFFRFPYMATTRNLRSYLKQRDIQEFIWAIDTNDWRYRNPDYLLNYALRQVDATGRGIILFHDIQPQTIAIMPAFIEAMINRGYAFSVYK